MRKRMQPKVVEGSKVKQPDWSATAKAVEAGVKAYKKRKDKKAEGSGK